MKTFSVALTLLLTFFVVGCKKDEELCSGGPKLEVLELPATFYIHKSEKYLGVVTVPASGDPIFKAAKDAPKDALKSFQEDFERGIKADANYTYSDEQGDTHAKCGASIKKGSPQYADAFKQYIYSEHYEVKDTAPKKSRAKKPVPKEEKEERENPCKKGLALKTLELPVTFTVYRSKSYLGDVTVPVKGTPTFKASKDAPKDKLKGFQEDFDRGIKGDAKFTYSASSGNIRAKCGMSVQRDSPEYAAAFQRYFYSKYYRVKEVPAPKK